MGVGVEGRQGGTRNEEVSFFARVNIRKGAEDRQREKTCQVGIRRTTKHAKQPSPLPCTAVQ